MALNNYLEKWQNQSFSIDATQSRSIKMDVEHITLSKEKCYVCGKDRVDIEKEIKNIGEKETWNGCLKHLEPYSVEFKTHTLDEEFIHVKADFMLCKICEQLLFGHANNEEILEMKQDIEQIDSRLYKLEYRK